MQRPIDRARRLFGGEGSTRSSFERDMMPHLSAAYALARWLVKDKVAAEDVVQDAFVRALGAFEGFRGENPRAWLLQIVRNVAFDTLDRRRREGAREAPATPREDGTEQDPVLQVRDESDDPETALSRRQDRGRVDALLAGLPDELRECVVLREIEGCSYKEISQITGAPIGTVMSRLWRARQSLARDLERAIR